MAYHPSQNRNVRDDEARITASLSRVPGVVLFANERVDGNQCAEHEEIVVWLQRPPGQEPLPRLTPDESLYLGVLRLEKELQAAARDSVRSAVSAHPPILHHGLGQPAYLDELLSLAAAFKDPEINYLLAQLAVRFPEFSHISLEIRLAVLSVLVDTPPPQTTDF